ncbi:glycosyltransferase family 2 protein [Hymenobacter humi]|uniref:Glycosyltransferase family 2 protein n=1 Tax=Hymenobacter humi TaxID=1411620 RepID=A0ABW2U2Q1_9BACT
MHQALTSTLTLVWYFVQAYVLGSCLYAISSAGIFLLFYNKIKRLFTRSDASTTGISTRFVLLIPAHNEARLLPGLLASIQRLKYPAELYKTVVIADNCTDNTAAIAKRARGVLCLERTTPDRSDKAQALQYASGKLPFQGDSPEAVVCIIDADCALADDYLLELDKMYSQPGAASVVQSFRSVSNAFESDVTILDAAAEALRQWVLLGTRKLLGQGAFLLGLGCSMRQSVFDELAALPVTSLAEDKEWKIHLTKKHARGLLPHGSPELRGRMRCKGVS